MPHPEVLLEDVIKPLGLTITEAAARLGVTRKALSELVNLRSGACRETARSNCVTR
jgi:plasmid maintenance system antidote protein VapI